MFSQYIRSTDSLLVKKTRSCVCRGAVGDMKTEIGSEIIATQDQALTQYIVQQDCYKQKQIAYCRLCQQLDEGIGHVISPCPILPKGQYRNISVLSYTLTF